MSRHKIVGQYIVTLKEDANAHGLLKAFGIQPIYTYDNVLKGFSAKLSDQQVAALRRNPHVASIEQDAEVELLSYWKTQNKQELDENADPWGLDRIDQKSTRYTGTYRYQNTGKGQVVYILDTGIDYSHKEFNNRAKFGYDGFGGTGIDLQGHGTHVAGTVGGTKYGVAKDVELISVKILDDNGSGTWSGVIAGMDWVAKNGKPGSIANMSIGGGFNSAVNSAVAALSKAGIIVVVAAGNEGQDACNTSPASSSNAITVGASTRRDWVARWSNWGRCVDIYAPGLYILSAIPGGYIDDFSGTSMAAPHVAGVLALLAEDLINNQNPPLTPAKAREWLISNAHTSRLDKLPNNSPNRLLHKGRL